MNNFLKQNKLELILLLILVIITTLILPPLFNTFNIYDGASAIVFVMIMFPLMFVMPASILITMIVFRIIKISRGRNRESLAPDSKNQVLINTIGLIILLIIGLFFIIKPNEFLDFFWFFIN